MKWNKTSHGFYFPNPGSDYIQVLLPGNSGDEAIVTITDLRGRDISNRTYAIPSIESLIIDASEFDRGMYVVRIAIGSQIQVFKWQKN